MSDAQILTEKLVKAGATKEKVVDIIDSFGDSVDWSFDSLEAIIGTVWESDINSGGEPDYYIINEICRTFNVDEVTE